MSILDKIRERHGLPANRNSNTAETDGYSPVMRINYMTLANAVELTTEIISGLVRRTDSINDKVGDQRLLKRDIADMVGARLSARLHSAISTKGVGGGE